MGQQPSAESQADGPDNPEVAWWCRLLARIVGTVGGLVAIITGVFTCLSVHPTCVIAGILQILAGAIVLVFEAPICCTFIEFTRPIASFADRRTFFQKAIIFGILAIPPVAMCFGLTTLFGCALMFASGVLYGLMALGKKVMMTYWHEKQREKANKWVTRRKTEENHISSGASTFDLLDSEDFDRMTTYRNEEPPPPPQHDICHVTCGRSAGPAVVLQIVSAEMASKTAEMATTAATIHTGATTTTIASDIRNAPDALELPDLPIVESDVKDSKSHHLSKSPNAENETIVNDGSVSMHSSQSPSTHSKSRHRKSRHHSRSPNASKSKRSRSHSRSKSHHNVTEDDIEPLPDAAGSKYSSESKNSSGSKTSSGQRMLNESPSELEARSNDMSATGYSHDVQLENNEDDTSMTKKKRKRKRKRHSSHALE